MGDKYDEMAERLWDDLEKGLAYTDDAHRIIADAIREAVAEEREAILRIVQKADDDSATFGWIADQIRARGSS